MYNSKYYTCEQVDQRLLQGYYDDAVAAGYTGSKAQYLAELLKAINHSANPTLTADKVVYDPAISGLTSKNVKAALDELVDEFKQVVFLGDPEEDQKPLPQPEDITRANLATKAIQDDEGNSIKETYATNENLGITKYPHFNVTNKYSKGTTVYLDYDRKLYQFTVDHEPGAWNPSHVVKVDHITANIAQESGDSEVLVMSQKAVSDKLSDLSDNISTITIGKTTETNVITETIISKAIFGSKEFAVEKDTVYNIYLQSDGSLQQQELSIFFAEQDDNMLSEIANYGSNGFKEEVHVTVKCTKSSSNARLRLSYTAGVDNVSLNFRVTKVNRTDSVYEKIDKTKDELDNKINSANEYIKHNNNKMCLGIANTSTIPESPRNQNEFYFAFQEGEYSNFKNWDNGNVFIDGKSLHIIRPFYQNGTWKQTWAAESIGINTAKYSSKILGIANPTSIPLVPTFENNFGYIAIDAGTYNNFLEEDGNPIELDGEYVVYIRPAFQKGVFGFWYVERLFSIKHNYIPKCAGYADIDTIPDIPSTLYNFYYIAFKKGEYLNFKDYKGKNIVLDGNCIYKLRAGYNNNVFGFWMAEPFEELITKKWVQENNLSDEVLSASIRRYLEDHQGAVVPELISGNTQGGDNSDYDYLGLGKSQDGVRNNMCVAVGSHNMTNNTGIKCVTVGHDNLRDNSGERNTSVGYHSLFRNTSGHDNASFGAESQDDNTTGCYNTSFGAYSLQRNSTGYSNVAVGYNSMKGFPEVFTSSTNYSENVSIGALAMEKAYTCTSNVAIGYGALQGSEMLNDTCCYNVAIGKLALNKATSSIKNNIAIGYQSQQNNAQFKNCITIGVGLNVNKDGQMILGTKDITEVLFCENKKIIFNSDGSVTWEHIEI